MWIKKKSKSGEKSLLFKRDIWKYISNGNTICFIREYSFPTPSTPGSRYKGCIYYSVAHEETKAIFDVDIDILKLKCLLKAKEMGWHIKGVVF